MAQAESNRVSEESWPPGLGKGTVRGKLGADPES